MGHEQHEIWFFGAISTCGEGDDHHLWCILAIRSTLDFVPNVQTTFVSSKTHQIET
jgi:hypothetical protein